MVAVLIMSGFWVYCGRRVRRRYQVWWEDLETLESNQVQGTGSHLTEGARLELASLGPRRGGRYRRLVVEVSWRCEPFP